MAHTTRPGAEIVRNCFITHGRFFGLSGNPERIGDRGRCATVSVPHVFSRNRAVELTSGQRAAPYLAMATTVSVSKQDRAEFE